MNETFMKQDRVYFSKEFSVNHLEPLMDDATVQIQVQALEGPSTNMILHRSTDYCCNLKKGWADFAVNNNIKLQTVCILHFYKTSHLGATIDIF
uniref:TF-B3 domain-containing protein n=1 Tax=Oryza nivara TaxID=4536 RepID=A0A0E0HR88_ORYNI